MTTITFTQEQFQIFLTLWAKAKQADIQISEWTGETTEQIEARYQLPADEILEDMADAFFANVTGIPMF